MLRIRMTFAAQEQLRTRRMSARPVRYRIRMLPPKRGPQSASDFLKTQFFNEMGQEAGGITIIEAAARPMANFGADDSCQR
jgi:hypothetical protein